MLILVYFAASFVVDVHLIKVDARGVSSNMEVLDVMSRRFIAFFHISLVDLYTFACNFCTIRIFEVLDTLAFAAILTVSVATGRFRIKTIPFLPRTFRGYQIFEFLLF